MTYKIEKSQITVKPRKLKAVWTHDAQQDIENLNNRPKLRDLWRAFLYKKNKLPRIYDDIYL